MPPNRSFYFKDPDGVFRWHDDHEQVETRPQWPFYSEAMAVHPSQIKEYSKYMQKRGIKTEYDNRGRPKMEGRTHRRRYQRALRIYDKSGGYSDAMPYQ